MTLPEALYGVTKEMFRDYEALRRSGKVNMWGASRYLGWDCTMVISHYDEMATTWPDVISAAGGLDPEPEVEEKP